MMSIPSFTLPKGFGWQYYFILWLQSFHTPLLDKLATWLSFLGTESMYMVILPILFLAVNRTLGMRLSYVFMTSMFVNAWFKAALHVARPIGVVGIRSGYISSATGLSMPSGHAQGTMTFFAALSKWVQKRFVLWIGMVLVAGIGVSRVYLGLHWPLDVLAGWGLGLVMGLAGWQLGRWWSYREIPFGYALSFAILFPAALLAIDHRGSAGEYAVFLLFMGVGSVVERKYLNTRIDGLFWKRICIAIIAMGGIVAIQWALKTKLGDESWLFARDALIALWTTLGAPWVFLKLDLYRREESESFGR